MRTAKKSIGSKLLNIYNFNTERLEQLFQEQIVEISKLFTLQDGTIFFKELTEGLILPYAEMTDLKITVVSFVCQKLAHNIDRYQEYFPETYLTITSSLSSKVNHLSLDKDFTKILEYVDSNLTIKSITKKLNVSKLEAQRQVYTLQLLDIIDVNFPSNRFAELGSRSQKTTFTKELLDFDSSKHWRSPLVIFGSLNLLAIVLIILGFFEGFELNLLDRFFRLRGTKPNQDITLVTISDRDIEKFSTYPIADRYLAKAIENINQHQPTVIGIDLYRNLPQPPGNEDLTTIYTNSDNLIGVDKVAGNKIGPPPILAQKDQVGFADLVVDSDSIIRRSLMSVEDDLGNVRLSLGTYLALFALDRQGVAMKAEGQNQYLLGQAKFQGLSSQSGGYWRGDDFSGLQTLLNFQHQTSDFQQISFWDIYQNQFPAELIQNKIVIIGVTADSDKGIFYNPYTRNSTGLAQPISGVAIHANVTAQLLNAANGRAPMLTVLSKTQEILLVVLVSASGIVVGLISLEINLKLVREDHFLVALLVAILMGTSYLAISYFCFLNGLWIPSITPILGMTLSISLTILQYKQELKRMIYGDKTTKTANRKYFDKTFKNYLHDFQENNNNFSVVFCRVNNKFENPKTQNKLLKLVAERIKEILSPHDLLSHYEENLLGIVLARTSYHQAEYFVKSLDKSINAISQKLNLEINYDLGLSTSQELAESLDVVLLAYNDLDK